MKNKCLCIIQARMGSTRLPGKVLKKVRGMALLEYQLKRVKLAKQIDKIVVATTTNPQDEQIVKLCRKLSVSSFRGPEDDVLARYYLCAQKYPAYQTIMRLTADCPLIDPYVIDDVVSFFEKHNYDYATNISLGIPEQETFPDGMDVEVFKRATLNQAHKVAKLNSQREHVTWYVRNSKKFQRGLFTAKHNFAHFRLTVDNPEDFEVVKFVIERVKITDDYLTIIALLTKNPRIMLLNAHIIKDEGLLKSLKHDFIVKK